MTAALEIPHQHAIVHDLGAHLRAQTIAPRPPAHETRFGKPLDTSEPPQRLDRRLRLELRLSFVLEVLQIAAAAPLEVGARRLTPSRPRLEDADDLRAAEVGMPLDHAHQQPVAGCGERNEERRAVDASDPFAAGDELLDRDLDLVEPGEGQRHRGSNLWIDWHGSVFIDSRVDHRALGAAERSAVLRRRRTSDLRAR